MKHTEDISLRIGVYLIDLFVYRRYFDLRLIGGT